MVINHDTYINNSEQVAYVNTCLMTQLKVYRQTEWFYGPSGSKASLRVLELLLYVIFIILLIFVSQKYIY